MLRAGHREVTGPFPVTFFVVHMPLTKQADFS